MQVYMSMITPVGLNFTIRDWMQCRGQLIAISQQSALFSLLGTLYGGDGRTSFALPDLRSRSPLREGQGPGLSYIPQGSRGGQEQITLNVLEMPIHEHLLDTTQGQLDAGAGSLLTSSDPANTSDPDGNHLGVGSGAIQTYTTTLSSPAGSQPDVVNIPPRAVNFSGNTQTTGNNSSFESRNPYLGLNYQIAVYGIYPSRS